MADKELYDSWKYFSKPEEKFDLLTAITHEIQWRAVDNEIDTSSISKDDLMFCIDLLSRTIMAFIRDGDLKNNSGMIEYIDGNIEAVCSKIFGNEFDSIKKRKELLETWSSDLPSNN